MRLFILGDDGRTVVPCPDHEQWTRWMVRNGETYPQVCEVEAAGGARVLSQFVGVCHEDDVQDGPADAAGKRPGEGDMAYPFETVVIGGRFDGYRHTARTWELAETEATAVCELLRRWQTEEPLGWDEPVNPRRLKMWDFAQDDDNAGEFARTVRVAGPDDDGLQLVVRLGGETFLDEYDASGQTTALIRVGVLPTLGDVMRLYTALAAGNRQDG